jgi:glycosyltransferase involved in cell wall biosynthesis
MIRGVIPVLDGAAELAEAIASAEAAGAEEVVVVDGGSRDSSREIAAGFDSVTLLEQRGPGLHDAYNEGIAAAAGDRLGFIGHDDLYLPGALRALEPALGRAAVAFGRVRFELLGERSPPGFRRELLNEPRDALLLESMLARREALAAVGGFRFAAKHDVDWLARLRESGLPVARLPELVAVKRMRAESTGHRDDAADPGEIVRVLRRAVLRRRGEPA